MTVRASKTLLVWAAALFAALVAFNNVVDYGSNHAFVVHVLKMDTTFAGNRLMGRALHAPAIHAAAYALIITAEAVVAVLCAWGGWRLWRAIGDARRFDRAKSLAVAGLTLGVLLWFTGFLTVGGEWFLMWQSSQWNGQAAAFRLAALFGIVLIYLVQPDGAGQS